MTRDERVTAGSLATIFALRMLGLFFVLPVFALESARYPGGTDPALIGLAIGIYGLTQGLLQLPYGIASDHFGRKRVIVIGLVVFALGSFAAAAADSMTGLIIGRALQGAGAMSAAVTALIADLTREQHRTKSMALVGMSIALMFALSLVAAPPLASLIGLSGLFVVTGVLALGAIALVLFVTPPEPARPVGVPRGGLRDVLRDEGLLRLDVGIFVLHAVQFAMWVAIPGLLVQAGLAQPAHWHVYLPAVLGSFVVMGLVLFPAERRGLLRPVFLGAIVTIGGVLAVLLVLASGRPTLTAMAVLLFVFFCAFNVLEAVLPSLASRMAPAHARGAALGMYNTLQSLGFFVGGAAGGWVASHSGSQGLFITCGLATALWLAVAWGMRMPARRAASA